MWDCPDTQRRCDTTSRVNSSEETSGGVVAAAVTGILLNSIALVLGILLLLVGIVRGRTGSPAAVLGLAFTGIAVCGSVAGFVVSIALLLRKSWARIGALVIAAGWGSVSALGVLGGAVAIA